MYVELLEVRAVNDGHRPVQIEEIGLVLNIDGRPQEIKPDYPHPPLPARLSDGEGVSGAWWVEDLSERLRISESVKIKHAYAKDSQDHFYRGKMQMAGQSAANSIA